MASPTALTEDQIKEFKKRHWFVDWGIPPSGKFVYDDVFNSYVLVFEKQDGSIIYAFVEKDYTISDPSRLQYIIEETLKAVKANTKKTFDYGITGAKYFTPMLILIVIIIFRKELQSLLNKVTK